MKKILAVIFVCLCLLITFPTVESGDSGVIKSSWCKSAPSCVITNQSDDPEMFYGGDLAHICNTSVEQSRLIIAFPYHQFNTSEIYKITISFYTHAVDGSGNISVHALYNPYAAYFVPHLANWTFTGYVNNWDTPGGDFLQAPEDTKYINLAATQYVFNITNIKNYDYENIYGVIFQAEYNANITVYGIASGVGPTMKIYYTAGSGQSTTLTKDIWNLKGFSGATHKLASTIYSEISNCKALSWKNATSGYYYTYWPEYGILEDEYLNFGDGLFILTSQNTTWDHT